MVVSAHGVSMIGSLLKSKTHQLKQVQLNETTSTILLATTLVCGQTGTIENISGLSGSSSPSHYASEDGISTSGNIEEYFRIDRL